MPLVLHAIRLLSKGSSAAETYFALWCHSLSESIIEMNNRASLIAAAGYSGATNERTWKERMYKLAELGFIKIAKGKHGDISCVLIMNPHLVLKHHKEKRTPGFDEKIYNTILETIADYGMLDFKESVKTLSTPPLPKRTGPPPRSLVTPSPQVKSPVVVAGRDARKLKRAMGNPKRKSRN
jgi:hypothetical protein